MEHGLCLHGGWPILKYGALYTLPENLKLPKLQVYKFGEVVRLHSNPKTTTSDCHESILVHCGKITYKPTVE